MSSLFTERLVLPLLFVFQLSVVHSVVASSQETDDAWLQFRGPKANPTSESADVPQHWSKDKNIKWFSKVDGRGWSSPIVVGDRVFVTTAINAGESKPPQAGTEYSNDYVRELSNQGLSGEEITKKVMERDFELPDQVSLEYYVVCLDLKNGKELWKKKFFEGQPPGGIHRKNSFASETPVSDGKQVYVYVTNLGLFAYDLDGNQKWAHKFEPKKVYMEFGTGSSPVIVDDTVIVVNDNEEESYIAAFDLESGEVAWRKKRVAPEGYPKGMPKSGWSTPYVWRNSLRTEIVTVQPGIAISYDVKGEELWRLNGCSPAPASSSFAHNDVLYLNGGRGKPIYAIKPGANGEIAVNAVAPKKDESADESVDKSAEPTDEATAAKPDNSKYLVWKSPRAGTYIPTPVIYKEGMYVLQDNGILVRLNLSDGKQSYKVRISDKNADFTSSPWVVDGKLFCHSEQGITYVIQTGKEYKLLHSNQLEDFSMASPALLSDRIVIRTQEGLYCVGKM